MPRFSVRGLLVATVLVALAIVPLVKPSELWAQFLPAISSAMGVFATFKLVAFPKEKVFWACFLVGMASYLFAVQNLAFLVGGDDSIGEMLWRNIHGNEFSTSKIRSNIAHMSFIVWVHFLSAMAVSGFFSLIAQVAAMRRNAE